MEGKYRGELRDNPENMKLELWDNAGGEFKVAKDIDTGEVIDYFQEAAMRLKYDQWSTYRFAQDLFFKRARQLYSRISGPGISRI